MIKIFNIRTTETVKMMGLQFLRFNTAFSKINFVNFTTVLLLFLK